jgi:hypothetical protein
MKWNTKDGRIINIDEMTDQHLANSIAMLRRNGFCSIEEFDDACDSAFSAHGEMASYYSEQQLDGMKVSAELSYMESLRHSRK